MRGGWHGCDVRAACCVWCLTSDGPSLANLLMRSTVAAHTAVQVRGIGTVLQVFSPAYCQGSIQLLGPLLVSPGEPEDPVRGQAQVTEHRPEGTSCVDSIQEPLPHLDGQPCLRSRLSPSSLGVAVRPPAVDAPTPAVPAGRRAMHCLTHEMER
jgi:hypothetical protein